MIKLSFNICIQCKFGIIVPTLDCYQRQKDIVDVPVSIQTLKIYGIRFSCAFELNFIDLIQKVLFLLFWMKSEGKIIKISICIHFF